MMKKEEGIFSETVRNRLYRFASSLLGSRDDAEDAVQDTLAKLWLVSRRRGDVKNQEAFAMAAVRNLCIDRIRGRKETSGAVPDSPVPDRSDRWSDVEKVRRAIASLPETLRTAVHLKDVEGYPNHEIAAILNTSEDAVRVYLSRGRKAIREYVEKEDSYGL